MTVLADADVRTVPSVTAARRGKLTGSGAIRNPYAAVVATRTMENRTSHIEH